MSGTGPEGVPTQGTQPVRLAPTSTAPQFVAPSSESPGQSLDATFATLPTALNDIQLPLRDVRAAGEGVASELRIGEPQSRGIRQWVSLIFHTWALRILHTPLEFIHAKIIAPHRAKIAETRCKVHADFEQYYKWFTPKVVGDYVRSRSGEQPFCDKNAEAFARVTFNERAPAAERQVDLSVSVLGGLLQAKYPYGFAPVGSQGASWPGLERLRSQVAQRHGIVDIPSTFASVALEELKTDLSGFQLYIPKGMKAGIETVLRAKDKGYKFLVITMDTRECGIRLPAFYNQDTVYIEGTPWQKALKGVTMLRPNNWGWLINHVYGGGGICFPNVLVNGRPAKNENVGKQLNNSAVTWGKIEEIKKAWGGPIVIKGLAHIDDVQYAYDIGASAVVLSNHGFRQISQAAPTLYTALQVAPQVKERKLNIELWLDGGVYNGDAVCAAKAAGIDFVLCGRGPAYAGGFAGEAGLERWVTVMNEQIRNKLLLSDVPKFTDITDAIINRWGDVIFDLVRERRRYLPPLYDEL